MPSYTGDMFKVSALSTPGAPTVTRRGGSGSTHYGYKVVAKRVSGVTLPSAETVVTDGPASLSFTSYMVIRPALVIGADHYDIYRTTGGGTQGKIGSIAAAFSGAVQTNTFMDRGLTALEGDPPDSNTTGAVIFEDLPTDDPLVVGQLWNDSGTLKVSAGD